MVNYGGTNTQQAAPFILSKMVTTRALFSTGMLEVSGIEIPPINNGATITSLMPASFTKQNSSNSFQYGLNDKYMLKDSIKYLERLQQPFYTKFITVSNHYPYTTSLSGDDLGFPLAKTQDETINGYFATANYLDSSIKAFFDYLKESGLYKNSIIVLYGDHYGISNSRNPALAPLLGKNSETWSSYDNAMLQRVPYMVVIPGMDKGGIIIDTYGGEIDISPTLEHLLGIESNKFLQVGQDMLSPDHDQIVAFRSANYFVTPEYTSYSGRTYYTKTGEEITNPDENQGRTGQDWEAANLQLKISDSIQTGDLLRFFKGNDLGKVNPEDYSYTNSFKALKKIERKKVINQPAFITNVANQSTVDLFKAPTYKELHPEDDSSSSTETSSSSSK